MSEMNEPKTIRELWFAIYPVIEQISKSLDLLTEKLGLDEKSKTEQLEGFDKRLRIIEAKGNENVGAWKLVTMGAVLVAITAGIFAIFK